MILSCHLVRRIRDHSAPREQKIEWLDLAQHDLPDCELGLKVRGGLPGVAPTWGAGDLLSPGKRIRALGHSGLSYLCCYRFWGKKGLVAQCV